MNNIIIAVVLVGVAVVAFLLWKSKKSNPTDPNFTDPGIKEVDINDKR